MTSLRVKELIDNGFPKEGMQYFDEDTWPTQDELAVAWLDANLKLAVLIGIAKKI